MLVGVKKLQINNEPSGSMESTTETLFPPMTRFSISEDDDDAPLVYKRPRLSGSPSQSRRSEPQLVTEESEEDEEFVPVEDVESDSVSYEESEQDEEVESDEEDEEEEEEAEQIENEDVAGGPVPELTSSLPAVLLGGQPDVAVANRTVPSDSVVFNNVIGELQVVLTDPDVLDCPICLDPLSTPVFQCENGHIACSSCCSKVKRKCPSCCMPIGYNRCRAIEKVIESVKVSCKNSQHGCKQTMIYSKKSEHEQMCPHVTCFCPHPSCPFAAVSKDMYLHFGIQHAVSTTRFTYNTTFVVHVATQQKHIFLQEQHQSVIFILNHEVKEHGRALSVDCVGPSNLKTCFQYQITAKTSESTLSLQCVPEIYTKWSDHPLKKNYLTIPSDFFSCSGTLPLHLCIKKVVSPV